MENQFVTYELAVKLKELRFNEPCIAYYTNRGIVYDVYTVSNFSGRNVLIGKAVSAPLWQQSFDYFREKYNIHIEIRSYTANKFTYVIQKLEKTVTYLEYGGINNSYNTYQEARQACLEKLIELCQKLEKI